MAKFTASDLPKDPAALAEALTALTPEQLAQAEGELMASIDKMYEAGPEAVDTKAAGDIAAQIHAIRAENETRGAAAADNAKKAADIRASLAPKATTADEPATEEPAADAPPADGDDNDDADGGEGGDGVSEDRVTELVTAAVTASAKSMASAMAEAFANLPKFDNLPKAENTYHAGTPGLNRHLSLSAAQRFAPDAGVQSATNHSVLVASSDIPGLRQGESINDAAALSLAMHSRARMMSDARSGNPTPSLVATLNREFKYTLGEHSTIAEVEAVLDAITDTDALVAAGGWCAPSAIRYDFFNLICEEGIVDLPSVGILNRGGFRYPTSPSMADVLAGSPDGLWTWTETDDQSAVTGSPTKDCVRVPCPAFTDTRLACDGFCITAGNLMDFAYPENIANFMRLVMATRAHVTNARVIAIMNQGSVAHDLSILSTDRGVFGNMINVLAFEAADQRARFATCSDQIVEFLAPEWLLSAVKADYAFRTGVDDPILVDAMLMRAFDSLNVRVQFVQDYQVRTTGLPGNSTAPTVWPANVQMLAYLPGTWVRGQGLNLNLGVVRDSVLNATNDYTAAWAEDCYAVAQLGWLSRRVIMDLCVSGTTGAANITC